MANDMQPIPELKIKLFGDGADKAAMLRLYDDPRIQGFTTNPTLMRKTGVKDYERFAREILETIRDRSISFEVFADDFSGDNVYVKIPVTDTKGKPSLNLVELLTQLGIKVNVTALLTLAQVREVAYALRGSTPAYISVFAGRIADTGRDPVPIMAAALECLTPYPNIELIWASPRELLNVYQANAIGCHIITATSDILKKLELVGKDLTEYSLDTVRMFYDDAVRSAYIL